MISDRKRYKYETLLAYLKNNIESGVWGTEYKVPSEPEISKQFNLSRNTIRQAMGELERSGLLYRIRGKGTFVASKRSRLSNKIALVLYDLGYMTHPFTGQMIKGAGEFLERRGYALEILATGNLKDSELFADSRYAGFIFGAHQTERRIVAKAIEKNLPFVFAKNYLPGLKINAVLFDYKKAGYMLAEHLLALGHKKIALLAAGEAPISFEFIKGVQEAFALQEQELKKADVFNVGFSLEKGNELLNQLLPYSALITIDDNIAIELVKLFNAIGKNIPRDISITGCNDVEIASVFQSGITTVRLPIYDLGVKAAEKLLDIINGEQAHENVILSPELVVRGSTAPKIESGYKKDLFVNTLEKENTVNNETENIK